MVHIDDLMGRLGNKMFQLAYLHSQVRDGVIPDIYVQDPKHFLKYEEELKKLYGEGIGFLPYVSIHVRRGDYVNNPFYTDLSKTRYYQKAIAMFPNEKFLVFSDDPEFARGMFGDENTFQIMEGGDEIEDFNMMASCASQITANSSYSYWAAFLNPNPSKVVVCPREDRWYADGVIRTKVPTTWKQI